MPAYGNISSEIIFEVKIVKYDRIKILENLENTKNIESLHGNDVIHNAFNIFKFLGNLNSKIWIFFILIKCVLLHIKRNIKYYCKSSGKKIAFYKILYFH